MVDIETDIKPVCSFTQNGCLETPLARVYADIKPTGSFAQSVCLEASLGRIYAEIKPTCSFAQSSCLQVAKINILRAYTQPITATEQTTDDITLTWGS